MVTYLKIYFFLTCGNLLFFVLFWDSSSFSIREIIFIIRWKIITHLSEISLLSVTCEFKKFIEEGVENKDFFSLRVIMNILILMSEIFSYFSSLWNKRFNEINLLEIKYGLCFIHKLYLGLLILYGYILSVIQKKYGVQKCLMIIVVISYFYLVYFLSVIYRLLSPIGSLLLSIYYGIEYDKTDSLLR
jgi:hypothetical protein